MFGTGWRFCIKIYMYKKALKKAQWSYGIKEIDWSMLKALVEVVLIQKGTK